ncbi:MAG: GyrI-like domain-containing protein [Gemmatimonadaceae bacterium]
MDVQIKQLPAMRVGAIRHIGAYNRISEAFETLCGIAGPAGILEAPDTEMVALYHDDPESTPADQLRSDAGLTMPAGATLPNGLTEQRIPAGRYASTVHVGPYEQLPDSWKRFMGEWIPASGHRLRDDAPAYEVYLNDPGTTPKEELQTEIRLPLTS